MNETCRKVERLRVWLRAIDRAQVAVSGGVDSMTLALLTGAELGKRASMFHARSPAVPPVATQRVVETAAREGWDLRLIDAGEFDDELYLSNPYRRCFHCKDHLYAALAGAGSGTLLSGTNMDDLRDFRPGLEAAEAHGVRHPFVECGVDKDGVRRLCGHLGYALLAELPASPCLSSRIETGLRIKPAVLRVVDLLEDELRTGLSAQLVRCRVRPAEIAVQLEAAALSGLSAQEMEGWRRRIRELAEPLGLPSRVRFETYQMGSAFVPNH